MESLSYSDIHHEDNLESVSRFAVLMNTNNYLQKNSEALRQSLSTALGNNIDINYWNLMMVLMPEAFKPDFHGVKGLPARNLHRSAKH